MAGKARYLGVDCGGSQSRWQWQPETEGPPGRGPAVQPSVQGLDKATAALAGMLRQATRDGAPAAAVVAMPGVGDRATAARVRDGLRAHGILFRVAPVADLLAATVGALDDAPGVLLWSGTGSFAVARGRGSRLHRAGGRGFLLGDQGSGYDLVRRAAAAAVLAADGLGPATALGEALAAAFGVPPARLGVALQQSSTGEVAAKLPVVLACAEANDLIANQVLEEGGDALIMVAGAAVRAVGLDWAGLRAVLGGGVLVHAQRVRDLLQRRLAAFGAGSIAVADELAGARGAALLASAWHQLREPLCTWVDDVAI